MLDFTTYETAFLRSIEGAEPERFDEITLGYERLLSRATTLTLRGIRRHLGTTFQQGVDFSRSPYFFLGTPGRGDLAFLPKVRRDYLALEVEVNGRWREVQFRTSYVLSRTWGNYTGLYGSDVYFGNPGVNYGLNMPHQAPNSTGFLPNDRPHALKFAGTYQLLRGLSVGAFFTWQSGTPINEFGAGPGGASGAFLVPRGSVGRTPSIGDFNLRISYDAQPARGVQSRGFLDLLHVGNPRTTVRVDQIHFQAIDAEGNQITPNPNYLLPTAFQPPMAARLGMELRF